MQDPTAREYSTKPAEYFDGAREDIVARLPSNPSAKILEIGCGNGSTGTIAKAQGKCAVYVGVDVDERAADLARKTLDSVVLGNVEHIDFAELGGPFDAAILSEVLEHLLDPWAVVSRLQSVLQPGALIFASSPNVANLGLVRQLLKNRFDYAAAGVMDRTHLRWFTSETYTEMFENAGFTTLSSEPLRKPSKKWLIFNAMTGGLFAHLASSQIMYCGRNDSNFKQS